MAKTKLLNKSAKNWIEINGLKECIEVVKDGNESFSIKPEALRIARDFEKRLSLKTKEFCEAAVKKVENQFHNIGRGSGLTFRADFVDNIKNLGPGRCSIHSKLSVLAYNKDGDVVGKEYIVAESNTSENGRTELSHLKNEKPELSLVVDYDSPEFSDTCELSILTYIVSNVIRGEVEELEIQSELVKNHIKDVINSTKLKVNNSDEVVLPFGKKTA